MTVEQLVRDQLDRATRHVPAAPDLESAVTAGRRRRRHRRAGLASLAAAVVVAVPLAASAFVPDPAPPRVYGSDVDQSAGPQVASPAPTDDAAGADIDETITTVVAEHLPSLPTAEDVYPSDSEHPGPITEADIADATQWIAAYALQGQRVEVSVGYASPVVLACEAGCTSTARSGWELQSREADGWHETDPGGAKQWVFITQVVHGFFFVNVREEIVAASLDAARAQRTLDHDAVVALVTDPRLTDLPPTLARR